LPTLHRHATPKRPSLWPPSSAEFLRPTPRSPAPTAPRGWGQ